MYPTFEKIREIAAGDYKRIPICKELYADSYTPVEMMRILQKASHHCYLLESASQSEAWGRYSFLGYDPSMEITCTDGILRIRKTSKTEIFGRSGNAAESSTESSTGDFHGRIISQKRISAPRFALAGAFQQIAVQKAVQKRFDRLPIQAMPSVKSSVSTKVRLWTICPHLPAAW